MAAWTATLLLSSSLVWAVSWYRPAQSVGVVLVGAGYETNLAVPHNLPGWLALNDLADYAHGTASGAITTLAHRPQRLHRDFRWAEVLDDTTEDTLLLYIAAHGAADLAGPYLLPDDTTGAQAERLRLEGLWKALAELPDSQRKLVCFDVTGLAADARLGILNNGFARSLRELNETIADVPNLVVICSSDVNQQSWSHPEHRRSQFGRLLLEGLAGNAADLDDNGRINAAELHGELIEQLASWTPRHCGAQQTPLLLPLGNVGEQRACRLELTGAAHRAIELLKPKALAVDDPHRQQAWQQYQTLMQADTPPYAYAPAFWREYVDTLIRADELLLAGDVKSARQLFASLATIEEQMLSERNIALTSLENSLACYTVVGSEPLPLAAAGKLLDQLSTAEPAQLSELWHRTLDAGAPHAQSEELLRLALFTTLWQRTLDAPQEHLAQAANIVAAVRSPLHPLPAEIHFLTMLHAHLPADALSGESLALVQQALRLRDLAERAAVACPAGNSYTPQRSLAWIKDRVREADRQRRFGEDLLFAAANDRTKAVDYFTRATRGYQQALDDALRVQAAYATRDQAFALLPYYSGWAVDSTTDRREQHVDQHRLQQVNQLWQQLHALDQLLAQPDPRYITTPPAPSSSNSAPQSLVQRTDAVELAMAELRGQYQESLAGMASSEVPADSLTIIRLLKVPHAQWQLRQRLTLRLAEISQAEPHQLTTSTQQDSSLQTMIAHAKLQAVESARWHGKLALASLGRSRFSEHFLADSETYDQLNYRLDMTNVEPQWWESVTRAGAQLHSRWQYQPQLLDEAMRQTSVDDPHDTLTAIALADRLIRQLDGDQASHLTDRPDVTLRRFVLHRLVNFLAERAIADHWYDLDPLAEPYFRQAALAYLADATRLYPDSPRSADLHDSLANAGTLTIANLAPLTLTTQRQLQLQYDLRSEQSQTTTPGYPVCWLGSGSGLELIEPGPDQRVVRLIDETHRHSSLAFAVRSPLLEHAAREGASERGVTESDITLNVFFRGQHLLAKAPVRLHPVPEITMIRHPLPAAAAVSINASDALRQQYGSGNGAIAFVLDCSGSMGPAKGINNPHESKYAEATRALRQVLAQVPAGTQISVWTFGQAVGSQRTALSAESTITCVQPPISWQPTAADQQQALLTAIDPARVTPWNESPIVRTMLAAKGDLDSATGFRSMVVITDGMDNRFATDRHANPKQRSIPAALTAAFDGSGVAVNVIGFKVVGAEAAEVQRQFSVVEQLQPAGRLESVDHVEALAASLAAALRSTLRFSLQPYDAQPTPAPLELGQLRGGEVWPLQGIMPGSYQLNLGRGQAAAVDLLLNSGDSLSLSLKQSPTGLALEHEPYAPRAYAHRPAATNDRWLATCLQNQASKEAGYRGTIGLERSGTVSGPVLEPFTPTTIWFDASGIESEATPDAVSWRRMLGYPLAAYQLTADGWPTTPDQHAPEATRLRLWWTTDRTPPYVATMRRTADRPALSELTGTVIQAAQESVRIESVTVEEQPVEVAPGRRELRSCLVVRLRHAPEDIYWAQPIGLDTAGAEQRFYPSVGSYTGLYWPVTAAEATRSLQGLGVVSLEAFQQEAERRGTHLQFDKLPAADPHDVLPPPAISFE